jgi:DNA-binding MarR family transcriptional regulator
MAAETSPDVDAVVQSSFAVLDVLTASAAQHGLSLTQLRLLGILRDRSPSMAAIADHLGLDRSSVSGLIDRAERRGLVARRTSADDARVTIIDLTAGGLELAEELAGTVDGRIEALLKGLTAAERRELAGLALRLTRSAH